MSKCRWAGPTTLLRAYSSVLITERRGRHVRRYWVYMMQCSDGSLYTGYTVDVAKRIARHNSGRGSKYTASRLPVTLAYLEEAGSLAAALQRELAMKKLGRDEKLRLCASQRGKDQRGHC